MNATGPNLQAGCGCEMCQVLYAFKCDVCGEKRLAEGIIETVYADCVCHLCAMGMLSTPAGRALIEETIEETIEEADVRLRSTADPAEPKSGEDSRTITSIDIEGGTFVLGARPESTMQPVPGYERCQRSVAGAALREGQLVEYCDGIVYPIGHSNRSLPPAVKPEWVAPGSWVTWVVVGCFAVGILLVVGAISVYRSLGGA